MTNAAQKAFASDTITLFNGTKQGHMGKYMFSSPLYANDPVRGAEEFADVFNRCARYYIPHDEQNLITQVLPKLAPYNTVIDFGCGTRESVETKAIPLLKATHAANYCAVDINRDYLNDITHTIQSAAPDINHKTLCTDFSNANLKSALNAPSNDNALAIMLGGTAMNLTCTPHEGFPKDDFIALIENCLNALPQNSDMVITYDSCTNADKIYHSYYTKRQAAFATNLMHRIKRDLTPYGTFDPAAWRYTPQIIPHDDCLIVAQNLTATKDMTFCIGDQQIHAIAGLPLTFGSSIKPSAELIKNILETRGITTTRIARTAEQTVTWHEIKQPSF